MSLKMYNPANIIPFLLLDGQFMESGTGEIPTR